MLKESRYVVWCLLLGIAACLFSCRPSVKETCLMSYNIRNGRGLDDSISYTRIAEVIRRVNPDLVALQELDSMTLRSGQTYVLGELARLTGMYDVYAPAIDYDGGKYGIGMLAKEKPLHVYSRALPGREEARRLLMLEYPDYVYACVHLSLTEEDRMASLPVILEEFGRFRKPVFIAGDWNATSESLFIQEVLKHFVLLTAADEYTFQADTPNCTLDYIAVSKLVPVTFRKREAEVVDAPVESDHRPVVVRTQWQYERKK